MHIDFDCSGYSGSSLSRHSIAIGNQSAYLQPFLETCEAHHFPKSAKSDCRHITYVLRKETFGHDIRFLPGILL